MAFVDKLIDSDKIADLLNSGATCKNEAVAIKYIEKIIELRGLEDGLGKKIKVIFPGLEQYSKDDWETFAEENKPLESREDIEQILFNKVKEPTKDE